MEKHKNKKPTKSGGKTSTATNPREDEISALMAYLLKNDGLGNAASFDPWPLAEILFKPLNFDDFVGAADLLKGFKETASNYSGPELRHPINRLDAASRCLSLRASVVAGDGYSVIEAVAICATWGLLMPGWLAAAFATRYQAVALGLADDWSSEEAFGAALEKGKSARGPRLVNWIGPLAYQAGKDSLSKNPNQALDHGFYENLVSGVGKTAAQKAIKQHIDGANEKLPTLKKLKDLMKENRSLEQAEEQYKKEYDEKILWKMAVTDDPTVLFTSTKKRTALPLVYIKEKK